MFKLNTVFFLCFIISYSCFSQQKDTIYFNFSGEQIHRDNFYKKVNSSLFGATMYDLDTIVVLKTRRSYLFGEINDKERNQLFKLINKRNHVDTTKTMVIHYIDTLKAVHQFPRREKIIQLEGGGHRHDITHRTFIRGGKNCRKTFSKYKHSNVYHFYKFNNGHPKAFKKLTWEKDNYKLIRKITAFDFKSNYVIAISPKGDFFIFDWVEYPKNVYNDIKKGVNWKKHKKQFNILSKQLL